MLEDKLPSANLSDGEEECEVIPLSTNDAIDNINKLRNYFVCENTSEKTSNELNWIYKAILNIHGQSAGQTAIKGFF